MVAGADARLAFALELWVCVNQIRRTSLLAGCYFRIRDRLPKIGSRWGGGNEKTLGRQVGGVKNKHVRAHPFTSAPPAIVSTMVVHSNRGPL
jgi:hypothetical protein